MAFSHGCGTGLPPVCHLPRLEVEVEGRGRHRTSCPPSPFSEVPRTVSSKPESKSTNPLLCQVLSLSAKPASRSQNHSWFAMVSSPSPVRQIRVKVRKIAVGLHFLPKSEFFSPSLSQGRRINSPSTQTESRSPNLSRFAIVAPKSESTKSASR